MDVQNMQFVPPSVTSGRGKTCMVLTSEGERCKVAPCKGSLYCQYHGGKDAPLTRRHTPSFYQSALGPKLSEALQLHLNNPHHVQLQLYEELAVCRTSALQAIQLASPLFEVNEEGKLLADVHNLPIELRSNLLACMRDAMNSVRDMVVAASRIEKEVDDKVSLKVINLYIEQIINCIYKACGEENKQIAQEIATQIDATIRVPTNESSSARLEAQFGDVMTPDKMVVEMMKRTVNPEVNSGNT